MQQDEKLLVELTNHVAESLFTAYPEIGKNLSKVNISVHSYVHVHLT